MSTQKGDDVPLIGKLLQARGPEASGTPGRGSRHTWAASPGWMRGWSLLVKPSAAVPRSSSHFLVILGGRVWPPDRPPAQPPPGHQASPREGLYPSLQTTPRQTPMDVTLPSSPTTGAPLLPPGPHLPHQPFPHPSPITSPWPLPFYFLLCP